MATTSSSLSPPPPPFPLSTPSERDLLRTLLHLSRDISLYDPPRCLPRRSHSAAARRLGLLSLLFEELLLREGGPELPRNASLCLGEILLVLQRFKALLADCSARSRSRLLLQAYAVASQFHQLHLELATLLDILPVTELGVGEDLADLVDLARRQCRRSSLAVDPSEEALRREVLGLIREIEQEIVPERSRLESIFHRLGLDDSRSCRDEIECLEREIGDRLAEKWTTAMVALVGLLRYAKCVLFGASTPRSDSTAGKFSFSATEAPAPPDFLCPISLELMRDPVVAASGQTYDRESIARWFGSGNSKCPKTGQVLANLELVPNKALKNLIARWCRENHVPFEAPETASGESSAANKAALEAARMTASFLVEKLAATPPPEAANRVVHEIRQLAKSGSDNRAFIGEAGAVPLLVPLLYSDDPGLQLNVITALLNLSILEANKKRIMHADGAVEAVVHVMADGATWRAKENAAAAVLSLSIVSSYRRRLGRKPRLVEQLVGLARSGPPTTRKDALVAILSLAGERENIGRLVEGGVVEATLEALASPELADEAAALVATLAKRGGAEAVMATEGAVARLLGAMRRVSECARENAAAALVLLCRRGGETAVAEVAASPGIESAILEMMGTGTERARRKAAGLLRICRRWTTAVENDRAAAAAGLTALTISATTIGA